MLRRIKAIGQAGINLIVRCLRRLIGTEGLARRNEQTFLALQDSISNLSTSLAAMNLDRESVKATALYQHAQSIIRLLRVEEVESASLVRVGGERDGGYVMLNDISSRNTPIAYSIGINQDVAWDIEIARRGIEVFMYDHTIHSLPSAHPQFRFKKQGLSGSGCSPVMRTLQQMIEDNNHQNIQRMLLKVDVEGAEWDALETASSELLSRFSQIVIELHGLTVTPTEQNTCRMQQVLQKILITHQPVHVHGNCFGPALILPGLVLPWAVEVTFVSRRVYGPRLKAKSICFPTILDTSNRLERFDLLLGNLGQPNEEENKPAHKILS